MKTRVINQEQCKFHQGDNTPSFKYYSDGSAYCYGCQKYQPPGTYNEYTIPESEREPVYVEDIKASVRRILDLPVSRIRGLDLHVDSTSYYILWPDHSYYKRRFFDHTAGGGRYKNPAGHMQGALVANMGEPRGAAIVVEGELNALSIGRAFPEITVISPGGVSNFSDEHLQKYWTLYNQYDRLLVIVDDDRPGVAAGLEFRLLLESRKKITKMFRFEKGVDSNDVLVWYGEKELRRQVEEALEVLRRLPGHEGPLPPPGKEAAAVDSTVRERN